ncbi:YceD family protein [Melaminivora alkalimesophila]|uniref:Large ribosomal RNA subunit accumulation protein YceD n=1 Tax=Melaminivora alkalimesophila TaxID=1165852 RepID=A0A317RAJ7_9BURK|nr:YceD family protein [Melaminivora alkalimesophila]PWW45996.1 uncharacterized protein DFR36_105200 [Melaminivora alkalimesophila]
MPKEHSPDRLDVKAFAQAGGHLSGHDTLLRYQRLAEEAQGLHPDLRVDWSADGQIRTTHGIGGQIWLRLKAQATVPLTCQRCLQPVDVPLSVEREFRFVADEATAEALDADSEEDLLVLSRDFNLRELIEDELIMALPLVPLHESCPVDVPMASSDEDFEAASAEVPNPFAALAGLGKKTG